MPELNLKDAIGFKTWAAMLMNNQHSYEIPDAKAQLDFYGEGDASYLVIDVYTSDTTSIQYVFLAANEGDRNKTIVLIFDLLKTVNYSLYELLVWLRNADYSSDPETGDIVLSCGLAISASR
jgi:hypothetical protein